MSEEKILNKHLGGHCAKSKFMPNHNGSCYKYSSRELEIINGYIEGGLSVGAAIVEMRKYHAPSGSLIKSKEGK